MRRPFNLTTPAVLVATLAVFFALFCHAQNRVLVGGEVGSGGGFGFKEPHLAATVAGEFPWKRVELQPEFSISPDVKTFAQSGHSISVAGRGLVWITHRVAAEGGATWGEYWSEQPIGSTCPAGWSAPDGPDGQQCLTKFSPLHKSTWAPVAGVVIRDGWFGARGRLRVEYQFPTGCVWATSSNPCPITSNRVRGVEVFQEFELWPRVRLGVKGGWFRYGDQVNPNAPAVGQVQHDTGEVSATLRYVLFGGE